MIYKGNQEISALYSGSKEVQGVYLGNKEVWSAQKVIFLGTAPKSIQSLVPKWREKSINNIFISHASGRFHCHDTAHGDGLDGMTAYFTESYSNGNADFYFSGAGSYLRVNLAYVDKPEKLISLGSGQSFNIKALYPTKYQNLTNDNFLLKVGNRNRVVDTAYEGGSLDGGGQIEKSYDASTGILTAKFVWWIWDSHYEPSNLNAYMYFGNHK